MVLMTDGDNDMSAGVDTLNGTVYSAYGRGTETLANNRFGTTSDSSIMTETRQCHVAACTKVKAAGIELYVTSFGSGVSTATRAKLRPAPPTRTTTSTPSSSADLSRLLQPHRPGRAQQVDLRQQIRRT